MDLRGRFLIVAIAGCLLLLSFLLIAQPAAADVNYEIEFTDKVGDVSLVETRGSELLDVDIIGMTSSFEDAILDINDKIILTLTVKGDINQGNDTGYVFLMKCDDTDYMFMYSSGVCVEFYSQQVFLATVNNEDTLRLEVPLNKIQEPLDDYNISGYTALLVSDDSFYADFCPDDSTLFSTGGGDHNKPLEVISPTDGATLYGEVRVTGTTHNNESKKDVKYVEYQVDGRDSSEWRRATSFDGWRNWYFEWDTTEIADGVHRMNIRAYNGKDYYEVNNNYWVLQESATNPRSTKMPEVRVGDTYFFEGDLDVDISGFSASGDTWMNVTLWGITDLQQNGVTYQCLVYQMQTYLELEALGLKITSNVEGFVFRELYTLNTVRSDMWANATIPLQPDTTIHTISTFDPPSNDYSFPLTVGDVWKTETEVTTWTDDGENQDTTIGETGQEYECLRTQDTTVSAGTFDTFILRTDNLTSSSMGGQTAGIDTSNLLEGYSLSYFSPDIGYSVKEETYDSEGNLLNLLELVDYTRGTGSRITILEAQVGPEPKVGEDTWVQMKIMNTGLNPANGTVLEISDSGVTIHTETVNIGPQETYEMNITWTPSEAGTTSILFSTPNDNRVLPTDVDEEEEVEPMNYTVVAAAAVLIIILIIIIAVVIVMMKKRKAMVVEEYEED